MQMVSYTPFCDGRWAMSYNGLGIFQTVYMVTIESSGDLVVEMRFDSKLGHSVKAYTYNP